MKTIIQTMLGVVIAGLVMFAIRIAYINYMGEVAVEHMNKFTEDILAKNRAMQDAITAKAEQERLAKEQAAAEERRLIQLKLERQAAFDSQYQVPEGCEVFQSDRHMAECVNHKMRARREFDSTYQQKPVANSADQPGIIRYSSAPNAAQ